METACPVGLGGSWPRGRWPAGCGGAGLRPGAGDGGERLRVREERGAWLLLGLALGPCRVMVPAVGLVCTAGGSLPVLGSPAEPGHGASVPRQVPGSERSAPWLQEGMERLWRAALLQS